MNHPDNSLTLPEDSRYHDSSSVERRAAEQHHADAERERIEQLMEERRALIASGKAPWQ